MCALAKLGNLTPDIRGSGQMTLKVISGHVMLFFTVIEETSVSELMANEWVLSAADRRGVSCHRCFTDITQHSCVSPCLR